MKEDGYELVNEKVDRLQLPKGVSEGDIEVPWYLEESIEKHGILRPLTAVKNSGVNDAGSTIISGKRRYKAVKDKRSEIPCLFLEDDEGAEFTLKMVKEMEGGG